MRVREHWPPTDRRPIVHLGFSVLRSTTVDCRAIIERACPPVWCDDDVRPSVITAPCLLHYTSQPSIDVATHHAGWATAAGLSVGCSESLSAIRDHAMASVVRDDI